MSSNIISLVKRIKYKFDSNYQETVKFLSGSQYWNRDKLKIYQLENTLNLLVFCQKYVPFYQKLWAEYGVDIKRIKDFDDFSKLPCVKKTVYNF